MVRWWFLRSGLVFSRGCWFGVSAPPAFEKLKQRLVEPSVAAPPL